MSSLTRAGVGTTVSSTEIENDSIVNADINSAAAIAYSKLAALTSAHMLVGSSGNVATDTAVTGDVTISNTGVTAIGAGKVTNAMLSNAVQVVKTSNETVNNSATLQDDNELLFAIGASQTWFVEAICQVTSASANADWKVGWTGPTGATANWSHTTAESNNSAFLNMAVGSSVNVAKTISGTVGIGAAAGTHFFGVSGWFTSSSTAGNIQLQWAQNTQTVEDNIMLAGSFLRLRRLI